MKNFLHTFIPKSKLNGTLFVATFASLFLFLLFKIGIYLPNESLALYGLGIFVLFPFFVGLTTPIIIGYHNKLSLGASIGYSLLALLGVGLSLLFLAIEGIICIVMAGPIVAVITLIGSCLGYSICNINSDREANVFSSFALFLIFVPAAMLAENKFAPSEELTPVTTSIEIAAPPEKVWPNVIEFRELAPPTELLFKTGVAYPIRARIAGTGAGAIRYCEFSTGAFVEPIKVWDENKLLQFSVLEQPIPMREISPYGNLDTPHLHDYFVSRQGQFKLTRLENGGTLLEGTTWYRHKIKPEFYWRLWTEQIVHTIHQRVLNHIKEQSEQAL